MEVNIIGWYVLRTSVGKEDVALKILRKMCLDVEFIFPRRRISWRKQGRIIQLIRPLFEGYFFVVCSEEQITVFDRLLRISSLNIAWLVYSAGSLVPILNEERQLIERLIDSEGIVDVSTVKKQNDQLEIVDGPLVGLENIIKKVSGRKRRITIEISLLEEKRKVELEAILL
ncbi:transcription termination/antitermination NusG family protein [Pelorhabdus rhamnosifermentans]|uniref:transcription termination/antitermination NusG family protein n=1 Tax=Pelorhabdus rhamnosifermentans TaxID=2772457 RepID=UPI001FECABF0|nr:transcription termination/antitermination NusG family protein [Pelorhabdus rhamnosifermentans]